MVWGSERFTEQAAVATEKTIRNKDSVVLFLTKFNTPVSLPNSSLS